MKEALTKFDSTAERILKKFHATLEAQPPPEIIYHYTNDVGLRGILETGQLWLTDIFNLNDPSELSHSLSHAVNILNGKAAKGPPESQVFAKRFAAFHHEGLQQIAHYFVCSFSSDGDELGQWRAYADNGRGYALGFDARVLEKDFHKDNGATFPVTYKDAVLVAIHREMIDSMFDLISLPQGQNLEAATVDMYLEELSGHLSIYAVLAALTFKHEAYKNEREYRFFQLYRGDVLPPGGEAQISLV